MSIESTLGTGSGAKKARSHPSFVRDLITCAFIVGVALVLGLFQNSIAGDPLPLFHQPSIMRTVVTDPQQVAKEVPSGQNSFSPSFTKLRKKS
jgi:hypothetical protein